MGNQLMLLCSPLARQKLVLDTTALSRLLYFWYHPAQPPLVREVASQAHVSLDNLPYSRIFSCCSVHHCDHWGTAHHRDRCHLSRRQHPARLVNSLKVRSVPSGALRSARSCGTICVVESSHCHSLRYQEAAATSPHVRSLVPTGLIDKVDELSDDTEGAKPSMSPPYSSSAC